MGSTHERTRTRSSKRLLLSLGIAVAAVIVLAGVPEFFGLVDARQRVQALNREIAGLHKDNDALRAKVRGLKEDPAAIEDLARRELGMLRPGEIVFIIKDVPKPVR